MKILEVSVSRSVRVNTGNYEGTEHFVSIKAQVEEFDSSEEALQEASAVAERAMVEQLCRAYRVRGKNAMTDPVAVGKHHGLTHI